MFVLKTYTLSQHTTLPQVSGQRRQDWHTLPAALVPRKSGVLAYLVACAGRMLSLYVLNDADGKRGLLFTCGHVSGREGSRALAGQAWPRWAQSPSFPVFINPPGVYQQVSWFIRRAERLSKLIFLSNLSRPKVSCGDIPSYWGSHCSRLSRPTPLDATYTTPSTLFVHLVVLETFPKEGLWTHTVLL